MIELQPLELQQTMGGVPLSDDTEYPIVENRPADRQAAPPVNLFDKSLLLSVSIGLPGNRRKVPSDAVSVDADAEWIGVSKQLLESKEYSAVRQAAKAINAFARSKALNYRSVRDSKLRRFIKSGVYFIPLELVAMVDDVLTALKTEFHSAKDAFLAVYPERREEARSRLRGLYDESDYPSTDELAKLFYVETSYLTISTPQSLQRVRADIFKREQEQAAEQWANATDEIRDLLRAAFKELVDYMADRLGGSGSAPDAPKKVFSGKRLEKVQEFIAEFGARNITGDDQLAQLVQQAKDILGGADVAAIRGDAATRESIASGFAAVKATLDTMLTTAPSRAISFDDEE